MLQSLEELSDCLVKIIEIGSSAFDERKNELDQKIAEIGKFLELHSKQAKEILNTIGTKTEKTPLMAASLYLFEEIVELLIGYGCDVNIKDRKNETALFYLIDLCWNDVDTAAEILKTLAKNGAYIDLLDSKGESAFGILTQKEKYGSNRLISEMISLGADVNIRDKYGQTPLIVASEYTKNIDVVRVLIESGAEIDARDNKGRTALMYSVSYCHFDIVKLLLDVGADIYIRDSDEKTAIQFFSFFWLDKSNCFILKLVRAYLQDMFVYFKQSDFETIQADVDRFLKDPGNSEWLFPVKKYHLAAMKHLYSYFSMVSSDFTFYADQIAMGERIVDELDFLPYFASLDFGEKLYADVINRISGDYVEIDGRLLRAMKARAKNEQELGKINELMALLNDKSKLAVDFMSTFKKATNELFKIFKRINVECEFNSSVNKKMSDYLEMFI